MIRDVAPAVDLSNTFFAQLAVVPQALHAGQLVAVDDVCDIDKLDYVDTCQENSATLCGKFCCRFYISYQINPARIHKKSLYAFQMTTMSSWGKSEIEMNV